MANFDKYKCFRNIRELLKDSEFRIGNIEKEAGCQPGYMSRLEKENSTTDPSMEFIVTAAKMLNVPVDLLLNGDLSGLTDAEQYLMDFIDQLIEDTKTCYVDWKLETESYLVRELKADPDTYKVNHPFVVRMPYDSANSYCTQFSDAGCIDFNGNSYHCSLPCSDVSVYLVSVKNTISGRKEIFYDLYLVENDKEPYGITPICSSREIRETLRTKVGMLYSNIEKTVSHVHIDSDVKKLIDLYMKTDFLR